MDRGTDAGSDRSPGAEAREPAEQRPIRPPKEDLDRWAALPSKERFHDPGFQRYAQSFRSRESLSAAGKEGYSVTVSRYGKEFLHDRMADRRREQDPPRSLTERKLISLLDHLGEREDRTEYGGQSGTYLREHKLAPSRHADFAWPDKHKAIEVWGGVHTAKYFVEQETVREANQRQIERAKAAGWEVMIVTDEDLRPGNRDDTRERVRRFLT
jgi:G:T-mismatch repair DNA endonuclease (very short patch repair protein)